MAHLLCITDDPANPCGDAQILNHLLPHWQKAFKKVSIWQVPTNPLKSEEDYKQLSAMLNWDETTHVWVHADLPYMSYLVQQGVCSSRLPGKLLYGYPIIDNPMVDPKYAQLAGEFDFFVMASPMTGSAMKQTLLQPGVRVPKETFKAIKNMVAIPIGIDTKTFHPLNVHAREYSREEIREVMFGDKVASDDVLIMMGGRDSGYKGLPQLLSIVQGVKAKCTDRRVKAYLHMPISLELQTLIEGNELVLGEDVLTIDKYFKNRRVVLDKERLNYIYNAVDLLLCADVRCSWPFMATEAMAAGTLVAGPDDFVWLDVIGDDKGVLLPATEFRKLPNGNAEEYARFVNCGDASSAIVKALEKDEYNRLRENGIAWAHKSERHRWDNAADAWLRLFGIR